MRVVLGSDHGGFELKEKIIVYVTKLGYQYVDVGCHSPDPADYPSFAKKLCIKVMVENLKDNTVGILFCGTGLGMSMAANRFGGIRAALCTNELMAKMAKEHNNANILVLGGRVIGDELAKSIVRVFLKTKFTEEERHQRRIDNIE